MILSPRYIIKASYSFVWDLMEVTSIWPPDLSPFPWRDPHGISTLSPRHAWRPALSTTAYITLSSHVLRTVLMAGLYGASCFCLIAYARFLSRLVMAALSHVDGLLQPLPLWGIPCTHDSHVPRHRMLHDLSISMHIPRRCLHSACQGRIPMYCHVPFFCTRVWCIRRGCTVFGKWSIMFTSSHLHS